MGKYFFHSEKNFNDSIIKIDVQYFIGNKIKIGETYFEAIHCYIIDYTVEYPEGNTEAIRVKAIKKLLF